MEPLQILLDSSGLRIGSSVHGDAALIAHGAHHVTASTGHGGVERAKIERAQNHKHQ